MEDGVIDADCCAKPSKASCANGTTYHKGALCWGHEFFTTCCLPTSTTPQVHHNNSDFRPGLYYVRHPVAVTVHMDTSSKMVSTLKAHQYFTVVEVATDTKDHRIRGRLQDPAGWASLKNLHTGHIWAHRAHSQASNQRKYIEQPSLQGLERHRTKDLAISFFSGLCSVLALLLVARRLAPCSLQSPSGSWIDTGSLESTASSDERVELLGH